MRTLLYLLTWIVVLGMMVNGAQILWDKYNNQEKYYFKTAGYEAYIKETSIVGGSGEYFIEITEPVEVKALQTYEEFQAEITAHNLVAYRHYKDFVSQRFYIMMLLLAAYLGLNNMILRYDIKELGNKVMRK